MPLPTLQRCCICVKDLGKLNDDLSLCSSRSEVSSDPFYKFNSRVNTFYQEKSSFAEDIEDPNGDDAKINKKICCRRIII